MITYGVKSVQVGARNPQRVRKGMSLAAFGVLVGVLALLVSACASNGSTGSVLPDAQQTLTLALDAASPDITHMDPAPTADIYAFQAEEMIFPSLVTWDQNLKTIPWAASSWDVKDGGKTYVFHIRPGLKWSDGTPIDANVFAYSINRALDPCTQAPSAGFFLFPILGAPAYNSGHCPAAQLSASDPTDPTSLIGSSIIVNDPQTLEIKLSAAYPYFVPALTTSAAMAVPKQLITQYGLKAWTDHLQGFGGNMFVLKTWDHKGAVDFTRNSSFWGTPTKLHEVDFTVYQDQKTGYNDYLNGRIDIASPAIDQYPSAKKRSDEHEQPALDTGYIQPVWTVKPFDNVLARRAFAEAINKQVLATDISKGTVLATNHLIPQGMLGYNPTLNGVDGTPSLTGNPAQALKDITAYAQAACPGGKVANCPPVQFWNTNDSGSQLLSAALLAQWNTAMPGYPISVHSVSFSDMIAAVFSKTPPTMFVIGYGVDYNDPQDFTSLQFLPGAGNNNGQVDDLIATPLMIKADTDQNPTERIQLYQQAEQQLVKDVAWIPLNQQKIIYVESPKVHNFSYTSNFFPAYSTWQTAYLTA